MKSKNALPNQLTLGVSYLFDIFIRECQKFQRDLEKTYRADLEEERSPLFRPSKQWMKVGGKKASIFKNVVRNASSITRNKQP